MHKEYDKFDILELALDASFIKWVKGDPKDAELWEQWTAETSEKQWRVAEARKLVLSISFKAVEPTQGDVDRLWEGIAEKTLRKENKAEQDSDQSATASKPVSRRNIFKIIPYLAAAMLAGFFLFQFWLGRGATSVEVAEGKTQTVILPDNSKVILNAASKVSYDKNSWSEDRSIWLQGEAFFDVKKGSTFKVIGKTGEVMVLGTSFNVFARDHSFAVDCKTGKVKVSNFINSATETLTAGTGISWFHEKAKFVRRTLSTEEIARWQLGEFHFKEAMLESVFAEFERQFGKQVKMSPSLKARLYSGFFKLGSVEDALHSICWPLKLEYKVEGETVLIEG